MSTKLELLLLKLQLQLEALREIRLSLWSMMCRQQRSVSPRSYNLNKQSPQRYVTHPFTDKKEN